AINRWPATRGLAPAAQQGAPGANAKLTTADIVAKLVSASERPGAVARHDGDAAAGIAAAARKIEAVYEQPFLAHATMEPMNCTVPLTKEASENWVGDEDAAITE